jgi:hypothetical protein
VRRQLRKSIVCQAEVVCDFLPGRPATEPLCEEFLVPDCLRDLSGNGFR